MPEGELRVAPGWIMLTAGVGGPAAKWRDKMLSRAILNFQKIFEIDGEATVSHAELLTGFKGETFAARWRTRERENGMADYIGSNIVIIEPLDMTPAKFELGWRVSEMRKFDGAIYPVQRLLLQGSTVLLPRWIVKLGIGKHAMCSEVVAKFFNGLCYPCAKKWRGITPAIIENWGISGRRFRERFRGLLTEELMVQAGLPTFRNIVNSTCKGE